MAFCELTSTYFIYISDKIKVTAIFKLMRKNVKKNSGISQNHQQKESDKKVRKLLNNVRENYILEDGIVFIKT